jgi:hypothetical protein
MKTLTNTHTHAQKSSQTETSILTDTSLLGLC